MTGQDLPAAAWRKSSRSGTATNCVEVAPVWRKSSRSATANNCVEAAAVASGVAVRDSKNPAGPALAFTARGWRAFTTIIRREGLA